MAEKIDSEKIKSAAGNLNDRVAMLGERVKSGKETVENFCRETPMTALGIALLVGVGFGFLLAKTSSMGD